MLKFAWVPHSEKNMWREENTLSNNMPLWMCHKVTLLYSVQREEMRIEMRFKGSDRKWVLFVRCGTRYFIKTVCVKDILYMLQGLWAFRKRVQTYEETTWHDSERHAIILQLFTLGPHHRHNRSDTSRQMYTHASRSVHINVHIHLHIFAYS